MATNRTFTMLKPDSIENGNIGNILNMITEAGFAIKAMKYTQLSEEQAKAFYEVHAERPFYGELVEYMTSGPIVAAILEKENAVLENRALKRLLKLKQLKEQFVLNTLNLKEEMPFTVLTLMKMLKSKVNFTLLLQSFSKQKRTIYLKKGFYHLIGGLFFILNDYI